MSNHDLFQLKPLVPIAVCLMGGIALGHVCALDIKLLAAVLLVVAVAAALFLRRPYLCSGLLLVAALVVGAVLVSLQERASGVDFPHHNVEYKAVVVDEPIDKGATLRVDLLITSGQYKGRTVRASLLKDSLEARHVGVGVGDGLLVYSRLRQPKNFGRSNFDYPTYLKSRGIVALTFVDSRCWKTIPPETSAVSALMRARIAAMRLRHRQVERYRSLGLSGQSLAVVSAMTFGDKSDVSAETREAYSITGASHILALSGMHLAIIYGLLSVLSLGRRFRELRQLLLIVAVWVYVFMVGMSPSVVRAALMLTVYSLVGLTGRTSMSLNSLAFAAILMLVANPLCLYDIGFQLSFMAVAFIVTFHSRLSGIVPRRFQQAHPFAKAVWQTVCMTTVAQLGTFPLVAYYFGRFSVYSLLANIVVIPAATAILYLSATVFVFAFLPFVQMLAARMVLFVVSLLNVFLTYMSHLPFASIDGIHLNALQVALSYCAILALLSLAKVVRNDDL